MIDPGSFGTALWTVLIVSAALLALGLAALSDMAMRRREDRREAARGHDAVRPRGFDPGTAAALNGRGGGRHAANGSGPSRG